MTDKELADMAKKAMERAYAPYSHYFVGAALLCRDGNVYTGCNIENASYSVTCCAERTALLRRSPLSAGKTEISKVNFHLAECAVRRLRNLRMRISESFSMTAKRFHLTGFRSFYSKAFQGTN